MSTTTTTETCPDWCVAPISPEDVDDRECAGAVRPCFTWAQTSAGTPLRAGGSSGSRSTEPRRPLLMGMPTGR